MVNNILIEVLGAVAQQEREKTEKRRNEGIAAMPVVNGKRVSTKTGNAYGRPHTEIEDDVLDMLYRQQQDGEITVKECCEQLGISRATWYNITSVERNKWKEVI